MSSYLLLMREGDVDYTDFSDADYDALFAKFVAWTQDLHDQGALVGVERLGRELGKTVRSRGGKVVVDGPFAEAKEAVVGLFILRADTIERACELAGTCPSLPLGTTFEVRAIGEFPKPG